MNGISGSSRPQILVLSHSDDITADRVEQVLLKRNVAFFRFDTAHFPVRSSMTASYGLASPSLILRPETGPPVDLADVRSIWYRQPRHFRPDTGLEGFEQNFVVNEAMFAVGGSLRSLRAQWMNHPAAIVEARYKLLQLKRAQDCGLSVPPTLVTNDPDAMADFIADSDGAVIKTLSNPVVSADAISRNTGIIFTADITSDQLAQGTAIRQSPCFLQKKIKKRADIRIVLIGSEAFSVEIASQEYAETRTDFRRRISWLKHLVATVPAEVLASLQELLKTFGLRFGVIDMALTPDGEYVFLEVNPVGQWQWLEKYTELPITNAVAQALINDLHTSEAPTASAHYAR